MSAGLGAFGEAYAAGYLSRLGYRILDRNVRYRSGELDLVAEEGNDLVLVEVKCRRSSRFGAPESSITARRFEHLARAIDEYPIERGLEPDSYRIDVVSIEVDSSGRVTRCEVLRAVERPSG